MENLDQEQIDERVDLYKNRRRMAYISLLSILLLMIVLLLILYYKPTILSSVDKIEDILQTCIYGMFGVILTYYGSTSFGDFINSRKK